jgi:hypothetical protein
MIAFGREIAARRGNLRRKRTNSPGTLIRFAPLHSYPTTTPWCPIPLPQPRSRRGHLRATGQPDKTRAPRRGSCRGRQPDNRCCVPMHEFRRFARGPLTHRPGRLRAAGEMLRFADPPQPMAAGPRASCWRCSRTGRSRSRHRRAELHSFVGQLAIDIVNQGDGNLCGHLHPFLDTDSGTPVHAPNENTSSHPTRTKSCEGFVTPVENV